MRRASCLHPKIAKEGLSIAGKYLAGERNRNWHGRLGAEVVVTKRTLSTEWRRHLAHKHQQVPSAPKVLDRCMACPAGLCAWGHGHCWGDSNQCQSRASGDLRTTIPAMLQVILYLPVPPASWCLTLRHGLCQLPRPCSIPQEEQLGPNLEICPQAPRTCLCGAPASEPATTKTYGCRVSPPRWVWLHHLSPRR